MKEAKARPEIYRNEKLILPKNPTLKKKTLKKKPYSVTLSDKSRELLEEIKEYTDAETVTEVFRDALRLSYSIMKAEQKGLSVRIQNPNDNSEKSTILVLGRQVVA